MKNQRDQLLDILASGMPFKCDITIGFDVIEEGLMTDTVPRDTYELALRRAEKFQDLAVEFQQLIVRMEKEEVVKSAKVAKVKAEKKRKKADLKPKVVPGPVAVAAPDKPPATRLLDIDRSAPGGPLRRWMSDKEVWKIRRFIKKGWDNRRIADQLDMNLPVIYKIRKGLAYAEVPQEPVKGETKVHVGHGVMVSK